MLTDHYYYHQLNPEHQKVYKQLYDGIRHFESIISFEDHRVTPACFMQIRKAVELDNPFFYYHDDQTTPAYTQDNLGRICKVFEKYHADKETVNKMDRMIELNGNRIIHELGISRQSPSEKLKGIHDYFCTKVRYPKSEKEMQDEASLLDAHTMFGVFSSGKSVCDGFSKAAKFLLNTLDIPCIIVHGKASMPDSAGGQMQVYHAWNIVRLEHNCYNIDFTWDNNLSDETFISYNYFNMPDTVFSQDHHSDRKMPDCISWEENLFKISGRLFNSRVPAEQYIYQAIAEGSKDIYFLLDDNNSVSDNYAWISSVLYKSKNSEKFTGNHPQIVCFPTQKIYRIIC